MDFEIALTTMNITAINYKSMTLIELKKQYHIMALKKHPDKNKDNLNANDEFIKVQEAFHFLKHHKDKKENIEFKPNNLTYNKLLEEFLESLYPDDRILLNIMLMFINKSINILFQKLLNNINKDVLLKIYTILREYSDTFNISEEIYNELYKAIETKYKNDDIIIINPNINDLLNHNIYVLDYKDKKYYIPLWHNELHYDGFIVKCIPDFIVDDNSNIFIDHLNNIHLHHTIQLNNELLFMKNIEVNILDKNLLIPVDKIIIKQSQLYIFNKQGIPRINENEIYNIDNISDIIVHLKLC